MKIWALLVLIALSVTILSSLFVSPPRRARRTDNHSNVITPHVCKTAGSAISIKAKTPALKESLCKLYPLESAGYAEVICSKNKPIVIAFQIKHPPRS